MAEEPKKGRAAALLAESMDLYAAVVGVYRTLSDDRAFVAAVLRIELPVFESIEAKWRAKLDRDPALDVTFGALVREYEWSFKQLRAGGIPLVEPA